MDIPYYTELQRRMFDIFRYASCHEKNFDTYSVMIESLLVDTCSFFDSLCQTFIREKAKAGHTFKQQSKIKDFAKTVSGGENFCFADYRTLLEGEFVLSKMQVNINPYEDALYSNPMNYLPSQISGYLILPFEEWATGKSSPWWKAFTDLKHDRLSNFREAKLRHVIYSLAAVFMILSLRNEADFKAGNVTPEIYNLFFPKYWAFKGRVGQSTFMWS
jgi:hypothetical protein